MKRFLAALETYRMRPLVWVIAAYGLLFGGTGVMAMLTAHEYRVQNFSFPYNYRPHETLTTEDVEQRLAEGRAWDVPFLEQFTLRNVRTGPTPRSQVFQSAPFSPDVMAVLRNFPGLRRLDLEGFPTEEGWAELSKLSTLSDLSLRDYLPTDVTRAKGFDLLPVLPALQRLDINGPIPVVNFRPLAKHPRLHTLVVHDFNVPHEGAASGLSEVTQLREIAIYLRTEWPQPKQVDGKYVAPDVNLAKPQPLSDAMLEQLARLPNLQRVYLWEPIGNGFDVKRVQAALPKATVLPGCRLQKPGVGGWMIAAYSVLPLVLVVLQFQTQFGHGMARTIPGYTAPHLAAGYATIVTTLAGIVLATAICGSSAVGMAGSMACVYLVALIGIWGSQRNVLTPHGRRSAINPMSALFAFAPLFGLAGVLTGIAGFGDALTRLANGEHPLAAGCLCVAAVLLGRWVLPKFRFQPLALAETGIGFPVTSLQDWAKVQTQWNAANSMSTSQIDLATRALDAALDDLPPKAIMVRERFWQSVLGDPFGPKSALLVSFTVAPIAGGAQLPFFMLRSQSMWLTPGQWREALSIGAMTAGTVLIMFVIGTAAQFWQKRTSYGYSLVRTGSRDQQFQFEAIKLLLCLLAIGAGAVTWETIGLSLSNLSSSAAWTTGLRFAGAWVGIICIATTALLLLPPIQSAFLAGTTGLFAFLFMAAPLILVCITQVAPSKDVGQYAWPLIALQLALTPLIYLWARRRWIDADWT